MTSDNAEENGERSRVSRRRFVVGAGASGLATGLAGCSELLGGGDGGGGGGGDSNGTRTGDGGGGETTTVTWGFDATVAQDHAEELKDALHNEGGLSDDIEIQFEQGQPDTGERRANYNRLLNAGEASPDMFMMDNGWVNIFIQRGQIQNLTELLNDDQLSTIEDEYFTGFTDTAVDPESGDLFGVPLYPDYPTMLFRKDLVEEAGYSPQENNWATEPMTWEEWSNVAADTYDSADVEYGFTTQWDIYEGTACCTFNEVMSSWGGAYFGGRDNLFGPVGDRPITVNSEPVIQSLNMMRKFVHDEDFDGLSGYGGGFTPTNVLGWIEDGSLSPFSAGNAIFHRNWPYAINAAAEEFGDDLGVMPIPYAVPESEAEFQGTGGTTSALGGWHITANPNSQNLDAVTQVIDAAMREEFQLFLLEMEGWLPPRSELFTSDTARNVDPMGNYMDTLQVAGENTMPRPVTAVWADESSAIAEQANAAVNQDRSSADAMAALESTLSDIEG